MGKGHLCVMDAKAVQVTVCSRSFSLDTIHQALSSVQVHARDALQACSGYMGDKEVKHE